MLKKMRIERKMFRGLFGNVGFRNISIFAPRNVHICKLTSTGRSHVIYGLGSLILGMTRF